MLYFNSTNGLNILRFTGPAFGAKTTDFRLIAFRNDFGIPRRLPGEIPGRPER